MIVISEEQFAQEPYNLLKPCSICRGMAEQESEDSGSDSGNTLSDSSIKVQVIQRAKDYLTETYSYISINAILYDDGHCEIVEYSCYGEG